MATDPILGYRIREGVRRAVAARDAGWSSIAAVVVEFGKADVEVRLPLSDMHSPKAVVVRDYRYIRSVEYPTATLGTQPSPIAVSPVRSPLVLASLTPIALVKLV